MLNLIDIKIIKTFPLNEYIKIEFGGKFYVFKIEEFIDEDLNLKFRWFLWIEDVNTKELKQYKSHFCVSTRNGCNISLLNHIKKLIENKFMR